MQTVETKNLKESPKLRRGNKLSPNSQSRNQQFVRELWWRIPLHVALLLGVAVMLLPFIWMLATSFKPANEVVAWPPNFVPRSPSLDNYIEVFQKVPFARYFFNSVLITAICTVTTCFTSALAGYIFACFKFPGRSLLFIILLGTAIVPFETYMLPLYLLMKDLRAINTYQGVMAPYFIMSFGIFFMRQNYLAFLPEELLDAARIDGAGEWRIFTRIVLPLSTSALSALAILGFIQVWGIFIWPLLITNTNDMRTVEVGLANFQTGYVIEYGPIMAGSVISLLPILVVFLVLRRQIIDSVALTGMKG